MLPRLASRFFYSPKLPITGDETPEDGSMQSLPALPQVSYPVLNQMTLTPFHSHNHALAFAEPLRPSRNPRQLLWKLRIGESANTGFCRKKGGTGRTSRRTAGAVGAVYAKRRAAWYQQIIKDCGSKEVAEAWADAYSPAMAKLGKPPKIIPVSRRGSYFRNSNSTKIDMNNGHTVSTAQH